MLSRTSTIDRSARNDSTADAADRSGPSKIPIPCAIADLTWSGSGERSEAHEPRPVRESRCEPTGQPRSRGWSCRSRLDRSASPTARPWPAPRDRRRRGHGPRSSSADPAGCRVRSAEVRSGGKSFGRPAMSSWLKRSARGTSLSTCRPRSRSVVPVGQCVGDEDRGRLGQDHLAAMSDGRDPGRPVDVETAVVIAGEMRLAGVQAHPDADRGVRRATARRASARCAVDRGGDGGARLRECREQSRRPRSGRRPRRARSTASPDQREVPLR